MATQKQKKAIEIAVENGGNVSRAMREAGYSPLTAKTPQKLTESKAWLDLMEEFLPDKTLAKVHNEGLKATTKKPHLIDRDDKGRPVYEYVKEEDYATRQRYLDLAYKLKGLYAPDRQLNVNVDMSQQANERIKQLTDQLNSLHRGGGSTSDGDATGSIRTEVPDKE